MPAVMVVTPWEAKGHIDYSRLMKEFGTKPLSPKLLARFEKLCGGELHQLLRRGVFFSHRDLEWVFDEYEKGNRFFLYTGRGPSGPVHLGHLVPWILTQWLQEKFNVDVYFQLTDDEKVLFKDDLDFEETDKWCVENALDFLALGFKPGKTHIVWDTRHAGVLYKQAVRVAKHITFSMTKAVFGFDNSSNVGQLFFTSMQAVPAFLPSVMKGHNIPCLIPMGIDQDSHFRVARDVLPKLGFLKPAALHCKLVPGLGKPGEGKMSASDPNSAIYTSDSPEVVKSKIMKHAFSGGQPTVAQHRKLGGDPDVDASFQWLCLLEEDDKKLEKVKLDYKSGALLSGEMKQLFADKANAFLKEHKRKKEALRPKFADFLLKV